MYAIITKLKSSIYGMITYHGDRHVLSVIAAIMNSTPDDVPHEVLCMINAPHVYNSDRTKHKWLGYTESLARTRQNTNRFGTQHYYKG